MKLCGLTIGFAFLFACLYEGNARAATASYTVTFNATWSQMTHPNAYPAGAHFSSLIGGVHNDQSSFWDPDGLASAGIEQMAEVGGTTALRNEVQAAINAGAASEVVEGGGITSPGSTSSTFQVSSEFPLVTLVTMVAPSPDWFVGVHGFDLRDGVGWKNHASIELFPYDAGTEQGVGFSLSNPDTIPHQPIALLGVPFAVSDPSLGTFTFTRNFPGRPFGDYNDDGIVDAADYAFWRDSIGQSGPALAADGDLNNQIDAGDYDVWRSHFGQTIATGFGASARAAVPEPATLALLMFVSAGFCLRQRRAG